MKKLILFIVTLFAAGIVLAETGTIAAGSTSAAFTNASTANVVYINNVAIKSATATNDTYSVQVTKGAVDFQIASITATTNSVNGNVVVTNKVPVGPLGIYKITRAVTNYAVSVYFDIR